jgi:hypothetical protein
MSERDAHDLAILFYAANCGISYERLAFPHLSPRAVNALYVLGNNIRGLETNTYGRPILLMNIRRKMADKCGELYKPAALTSLN